MSIEAENGITMEELAPLAYSMWRRLSGRDDLPEIYRDGDAVDWENVSGQAIYAVERADGLKWAALASLLYAQRHGCRSLESESDEEKLVWEALARHLYNLVDSDGMNEIDLEELETQCVSWFQKKKGELSERNP